jgi:hypothetical protein
MRFAVRFLPPWYPVETDETEAVLANWIRKYLPTNESLLDLRFTVIGVCRARDEIAICLQDGRVARVMLPDNPAAPPSAEDPLEIDYFDDVSGLNAFISRDAVEHQ